MRYLLWIIACVMLLHSADKLEKVSIQLDWKYQFEFAGFIAAKEKGFYREAGLEVELREYQDGIDIVDDVFKQRATYGVYNSSIVIDQGRIKPIVLMATYFQHSPLVFIAQKGIKNPADMVGKKIMGTKDEFKYSSLALLMTHFGISSKNAHYVDHTFGIEEFAKKKVDVMSAFRSNQLYLLDQLGISYEVIDPNEYGFAMSAVNVFTSPDEALHHTERTRRFIDATNRGWRYALEHKDEIIDILIQRYRAKKPRAALEYEAKVTDRLMLQEFYPIGDVNGELTQRAFKQLMQSGLLQNDQRLGQFMFKEIEAKMGKNTALTPAEQLYLQKKGKLKLCVDPSWYPIEKIENNQHVGMASELFENFEKKIGIGFELVPTTSWAQSIDYANERKCDVLSLSQKRPEREEKLHFTTPIFSFPYVLVTQITKPFIDDLSKLKGKKIAEVRQYAILEQLNDRYPDIERVEVNSIAEGLEKVEKGEVYGYVDNLAAVSSHLQQEYPGILKVSMRLEIKDDLAIGTRNDEPLLGSIFQKLVDGMSQNEIQSIYNRWMAVTEEVAKLDSRLMIQIGLGVILLILIFVWRYYVLKRYNEQLLILSVTDKLTGLYNRQKTDERLMEEQRKINRYSQYSCSIMMIDVDYFKHINDTSGHQAGDKVLQSLASMMRCSLRSTDMIGRWGGEEFIIILPLTQSAEALKIAELLRQRVFETDFGVGSQLSISIGVGEFLVGESVHECIGRIDHALYDAKAGGRNRVIKALERLPNESL